MLRGLLALKTLIYRYLTCSLVRTRKHNEKNKVIMGKLCVKHTTLGQRGSVVVSRREPRGKKRCKERELLRSSKVVLCQQYKNRCITIMGMGVTIYLRHKELGLMPQLDQSFVEPFCISTDVLMRQRCRLVPAPICRIDHVNSELYFMRRSLTVISK